MPVEAAVFRDSPDPRSHDHALQALGGDLLVAVFGHVREVLRDTVAVRAARRNVVSGLGQRKERLNVRFSIHLRLLGPVHPRILHDRLRHPATELFFELFLVMTAQIVAPRPCARTMFLHLAHEPIEVVPPKLSLPHHENGTVRVEHGHVLFVEADVEVFDRSEYVHRVADHVRADLVVFGRSYHALVRS